MGAMDPLDHAVARLPECFAGPGGAVAVLRDGEVLARHAWGYADAERRQPFTASTQALVCSITKQFTSALLLDRFPDIAALDHDVAGALPGLGGATPRVRDLCHNQSGLRDYWALAMLCGAGAEDRFGPAEASALIPRAGSHFAPGTRYSYANQNFRILSDLIERRLQRPFAELLRAHVLDPAEMPSARLHSDTSAAPCGTIGYEGTSETGFRPAANRIHWTGDAGLAASLDDMIAWERHLDATRDDPASLYRRLSAPVAFGDGRPASYGFGLGRHRLHGRAATSHAGGLRGWRSFRCYLPAERLSAVVLFNHMADPRRAALNLLGAVLGLPASSREGSQPPAFAGRYLEPETGLTVRVEKSRTGDPGVLRLHFAGSPESLETDGLSVAGDTTRLHLQGDALRMQRLADGLDTVLRPVSGASDASEIEGAWQAEALDAGLDVAFAGGVPHAGFRGPFGTGPMQRLLPFGSDLWLLPCPRALDFSPPGDWSVRVLRDSRGVATGLSVGCWLARGVLFRRRTHEAGGDLPMAPGSA